MSVVPHDPDPARLQEDLVAYLDGELDAETARRVENLLATDPAIQQQLNELQKAWDLLDQLPQADVDEAFTQSTIEMVAISAAEEVRQQELAEPQRQRRRTIAVSLGLAACALIGYLAADRLWPDANEKLIRDLPVVENLDAYRQVDELEFLRQLKNSGLFAEERPTDDK